MIGANVIHSTWVMRPTRTKAMVGVIPTTAGGIPEQGPQQPARDTGGGEAQSAGDFIRDSFPVNRDALQVG